MGAVGKHRAIPALLPLQGGRVLIYQDRLSAVDDDLDIAAGGQFGKDQTELGAVEGEVGRCIGIIGEMHG